MKNKRSTPKFSIKNYSDGRASPYGSHYGLDINEAVEELMELKLFRERYTKEEMEVYLGEMKEGSGGYTMHGSRWSEYKITKTL